MKIPDRPPEWRSILSHFADSDRFAKSLPLVAGPAHQGRYLHWDKLRHLQPPAEISPVDGVNHRQLALLNHALRHPEAAYTIIAHQTSHGIVYETARQDLFGLEKLGLLQSKKRGKAYYFHPVPDLQVCMKRLR